MQELPIQVMQEMKSCRTVNNQQSMNKKSEQATIQQDCCSQFSHALFHATNGLDSLECKVRGLENAG